MIIRFTFVLVGTILLNSIGNSQTSESPMFSICSPEKSQDYATKCNFNCTNESLTTVLSQLTERYGIDCGTSIDTMDTQISLKGNKTSDEWIMKLSTKYGIDCQIEYSEDMRPIRLGLVGTQEAMTAMTYELKTKYSFTQIVKDKGIYVNFKANQMPAWELFGKLAQESGTSIDYMTSGTMRLTRNGRTVLSFGTFEPFYVYLSKENVSGKIVIDFLHSPTDMTNLDDVSIDNIDVICGTEQIPVKGQNITVQSSFRPFGGFEWVSDAAVKFKGGVFKGNVSAWVLTGTYCVKNLDMVSQLKEFGLSIRVIKDDVNTQSWFPDGIMSAPDNLKGDWVCLVAQAAFQLPKEQSEFVQQTYQCMLRGQQPKKADLKRYFQIGKQLPLVKIELENPDRVWYQHGFESRAWLDSIQHDNAVFPMDLTLKVYRYQKISFTLPIPRKD